MPVVPLLPVGRFGSERCSAVGDVVFDAVGLDGGDGAYPCSVLDAAVWSVAECSRDVGGRVGDGAVGELSDAFVEDVADGVDLDLVGVVGGEVAGTAVLACVERGDLAVEPFGLAFEVGEVVTSCREADVVAGSVSSPRFAGLERGDGPLQVL